MTLKLRSVLLLAASALAPTVAVAADYDPPIYVEEGPEYQPVEVGSGWYIRGDISYAFSRSYKNHDFGVTSAFAPFESVQLDSFSEKENTISGSVGFGYHFNDWIRGDLNLGLLPKDKYSASGVIPDGCAGTTTTETVTYDDQGAAVGAPVVNSFADTSDCAATLSASNTNWTGTANAYVDLGTFAGLTPYVGGGIGVVYTKTKLRGSAICSASEDVNSVSNPPNTETTTTTFLCDGQTNSNDEDVEYVGASSTDREWNLLYSLNAGVAYKVTENASIDLGYQYVNSPNAKHVSIDEDGNIHSGKGIDYHQIKLGLRYDLW